MKKIILVLISFVFSISAYAQLDNAWQTTKKTVTEFTSKDEKACPVYANTPISKVTRAPWELEIGINALFFPSNGSVQVRTDSFGIEVIHNLSNAFGAFVRYDALKFEKDEYKNTEYDKNWSGYSIVGGFHFYPMPIVRIYGAGGMISLKDDNGNEPDYGTVIERGAKIDLPLSSWGYKAVLAYRIVDAKIDKDSKDVSDAIADGSYSSIGLYVSIPFGYNN